MATTTKHTILVQAQSTDLLDKHFNVVTLDALKDGKVSPEDIEGILISKYFTNDPHFRNELLPKMRNLKMLTPIGVGADLFEDLMPFLRDRGITVALNAGDTENCVAVADFAIGLIISCARFIHHSALYLHDTPATKLSDWVPYKKSLLGGRAKPVSGACIGIIGLGTIGLKIAERAYHGFGMKVLYHGPRPKSADVEQSVKAEYYSQLDQMLPHCDFVVVACASNKHTRGMLSTAQFGCMKRTGIVINVARGDIIDTEALVTALQKGHISGAGLDVTSPEPLPQGHPLLSMENVLLTPHVAWALQEVQDEHHQSQCQNFIDVLIHGKEPKTRAN